MSKKSIFNAANAISRIIRIKISNGKEKIKIAIEQLLFIAVAVAVAALATFLLGNLNTELFADNFILWLLCLIGMIACFAFTFEFVLIGAVCQLALIITAIIHCCMKQDIKKNIVALIIGIASIVGGAIVLYLILSAIII